MEFFLSFSIGTAASIFIFLVSLYFLFFWILKYSTSKNAPNKNIAPKVAGAWPIIGHLYLLVGPKPPHITFGTLADKYGPIFSIKLGVNQAMVVSDSKLAKECFTTNDKILADRPKSLAIEVMGYNYAMMCFGPYGQYWSQIRKVLVLEFLSNRRLEMQAHVRVSEVRSCIKNIYEFWVKNKNASNMVKMEMKECFGNLNLNVAIQMLAGKRYSPLDEEGVCFFKAMQRFLNLVGTFIVSDSVPYLRWLDLGGYKKVMRKTAKEMDGILDKWLKEHKKKRSLGLVKDEEQDFIDAMLARVVGGSIEDFSSFDCDTVIKAACLTLFTGGTDTTTVTLTWALSLLMNNPHALKMAQDELDIHVGRERQVEDSDMQKLTYLQAIIKETLRLYPALPLGVAHQTMEDCIVCGYHVPKGTTLFVNLWKIHHDPEAWPNPYEFQPERFLMSHKDVEVRGQHFELIPFGSGRRICPGLNFSLQAVQLVLASLIHGFEFRTPLGESIDMSESIGLTNLKATPLEVLVCPRLPFNVFG